MKVHGIGRFVKNPEIRKVADKVFCNFTLAYDNIFGDNKTTSFIPFVAVGKSAENISKFFKKGDLIEIKNGNLRQRTWKDKNNKTHSSIEVLVLEWGFCGRRNNNNNYQNNNFEEDLSDELPF